MVQSLRKWLQLSYDDFKNEEMSRKLDAFISTIQRCLHILTTILLYCVFGRVLPSCGKQLQTLKETSLASGPAHLQTKAQGISPTPLVPINLSTGGDFVRHT